MANLIKGRSAMKKLIYILFGIISLVGTRQALAQLPANPWDSQQDATKASAEASTSSEAVAVGADVGHIGATSEDRVYIPSIKYAPINADATDPVYTPAISTGASPAGMSSGNYALPRSSGRGYAIPRAVPATNTNAPSGWRGSGQFSKLGYKGEVTTYDKAYGQEMLAPEVNNENMNVMVQHLRNLGYNIPSSYDNKFSNFLQDYSADLRTAYSGLGRQNNPIDSMFNSIIDAFEHFTGLDTGNLLFNSIGLIQRD